MGWKNLNSKVVFRGKGFNLVEHDFQKPDGTVLNKRHVVERNDAAVIVTFTKKKELIMVKQYRYTIGKTVLEFPAGKKNNSKESILKTAKRELLEETGYMAEKFIKLGETYLAPGILNNKNSFFIAFNAEKNKSLNLDDDEDMEVKLVTWKDALDLLRKQISTASTLTAILLAKQYLEGHKF